MVQDIELRLEAYDIGQVGRLLALKLLVALLHVLDLFDLLAAELFLHPVDGVVGVLHEIQGLFYALLLVQLPNIGEADVDAL